MSPEVLLKQHHLKVTPTRLVLLGCLERNPEPRGVPELFADVKERGINYVSVYRTMNTFEKAGLVRRVNLRHGHTDYELVTEKDHHHHFVCSSCGMIEEFTGCDLDSLVKQALKSSKQFTTVDDHAIEFFGTCKKCV